MKKTSFECCSFISLDIFQNNDKKGSAFPPTSASSDWLNLDSLVEYNDALQLCSFQFLFNYFKQSVSSEYVSQLIMMIMIVIQLTGIRH